MPLYNFIKKHYELEAIIKLHMTWLQAPKDHMFMDSASPVKNYVQFISDITAGYKVLMRNSIISRCIPAIIILLFCIPSVT